MKRITFFASFAIALALPIFAAHAGSTTGNPVGVVDSLSCLIARGWSYDPDFTPPQGSGSPLGTSCGSWDGKSVSLDHLWKTEGNLEYYTGTSGAAADTMSCIGVWNKDTSRIESSQFCKYADQRQCDFSHSTLGGAAYSGTFPSCPAGYHASGDGCDIDGGSSGGGGGKGGAIQKAAYNPGSFIKAVADLFKPLIVWASSGDSNSVSIFDGPASDGNMIGFVQAEEPRPDVNQVNDISGNHGFTWNVPNSVRDGEVHTLYFYGNNTDGSGVPSELSNSPMTINCKVTLPPAKPSQPSLICPPNGSKTGESLPISFSSTSADEGGLRYLVDWDNDGTNDETVPADGFVASGSVQSTSRSWASAGEKSVSVMAEDSQGSRSTPASCSFTLVDDNNTGTDTTDNGGNGGGKGGGGGNSGNSGNTGSSNPYMNAAFTISADPMSVKIKTAAGYSGVTENSINITVNPVSGFDVPVRVTINTNSIPADTKPEFSFDNGATYSAAPAALMAWDGSFYRYNGLISIPMKIRFTGKFTTGFALEVVGTPASGSYGPQSTLIQIDPSAISPSFKEI